MHKLCIIVDPEAHYDTMYRRHWPSIRQATANEVLQAAKEIDKCRDIFETGKFNPHLIFEGVFELAKNGEFE